MSDHVKWDKRFLELAKHISTWSRDPSTKVGAVLVDSDRRVTSVGYNGFPKYVRDDVGRYANRELKLKMIVHAERNALLFAHDTVSRTLYTWPFMPCSVCAGMIIQAGVMRVVAPQLPNEMNRWKEDIEIARVMFEEADVEVVLYEE